MKITQFRKFRKDISKIREELLKIRGVIGIRLEMEEKKNGQYGPVAVALLDPAKRRIRIPPKFLGVPVRQKQAYVERKKRIVIPPRDRKKVMGEQDANEGLPDFASYDWGKVHEEQKTKHSLKQKASRSTRSKRKSSLSLGLTLIAGGGTCIPQQDMAVIEINDSLITTDSAGNPDGIDLVGCYRLFRTQFEDDYDFIGFFTDTASGVPWIGAFSSLMFNHVKGINCPDGDWLNNRPAYGSVRLHHVMAFSEQSREVLLHEIGHRWLAYSVYRETQNGDIKQDLLLGTSGQGPLHWGEMYDDKVAGEESLMTHSYEIIDWQNAGGGKLIRVRPQPQQYVFSKLDLYLMGLYAKNEVGSFRRLNNICDVGWSWNDWGSSKKIESTPCMITYKIGSTEHIHVFARGSNDKLVEHHWNGSGWTWNPLDTPFKLKGGPAAVSYIRNGKRHINVFARSDKNHLVEAWWNGTKWYFTDWGSSEKLGSEPSAVQWYNGTTLRINVFARGSGGGMIEHWYDGSEWHWHDWGTTNKISGRPAMVTFSVGGDRRIYLFARGPGNTLVEHRYQNGGWTWDPHDSSIKCHSDPAVIEHNGQIRVLAQGANNILMHWICNGTEWSTHNHPNWQKISGPPCIVSADINKEWRMHVLARGTHGGLVEYWHDEFWSHWSDWGSNYKIESGTAPAAIIYEKDGKIRINAFMRRDNDYLLEHWYSGDSNTFTADKKELTIQNIIWASGDRDPDYSKAQKFFRMAFVIVTKNAANADNFINNVDTVRQQLSADFAQATKNRGTLDVQALPSGQPGLPLERWYNGSDWHWHEWQNVPEITCTPSIITYKFGDQPRKINLFARGAQGQLIEAYWNGSTWRWFDRGQQLNSEPAAVESWVNGKLRINVFMRKENNNLLEFWYDGSWHWHDWGSKYRILTAPTVLTYNLGGTKHVHMFAIDEENYLVEHHWDGSKWNWEQHTSIQGTSTPGAIHFWEDGKSRMNVFVRGLDGEICEAWYNGSHWNYTCWGRHYCIESQPAIVTYREGGKRRLNLFARGPNNIFFEAWYNGSRWNRHDWGNSVPIFGAPTAINYEESKERIVVYVRTNNGRIAIKYWNGTKWQWKYWPEDKRSLSTPRAIHYMENGTRRVNIFTPNNP